MRRDCPIDPGQLRRARPQLSSQREVLRRSTPAFHDADESHWQAVTGCGPHEAAPISYAACGCTLAADAVEDLVTALRTDARHARTS